jgi:uncharacterized protein YdhG (YjbR/CyaY superfamily)
MDTDKTKFVTIDDYITSTSPEVQEKLNSLKNLIKKEVPEAQEKMSWQMPTFYLHGNLVHFFAHKHHIGFYPGASGVTAFQDELVNYKTSKGAIQFPLSKPLPFDLIRQIVQFRVSENIEAAQNKAQNKK